MPSSKTGRIPTSATRPTSYYVLQEQSKKNGPWTDTEAGWDEFYDKKSALAAVKDWTDSQIEDAKNDYENPRVGSEFLTISRGSDLKELKAQLETLHKKVNPVGTKKRKPFDPDSVYPKYRAVLRTTLDEPLEV